MACVRLRPVRAPMHRRWCERPYCAMQAPPPAPAPHHTPPHAPRRPRSPPPAPPASSDAWRPHPLACGFRGGMSRVCFARDPREAGWRRRAIRAPSQASWAPDNVRRWARARATGACARYMYGARSWRGMLRSFHPEKTPSHQNGEVNLGWAVSVLGREITWEPTVTQCFCPIRQRAGLQAWGRAGAGAAVPPAHTVLRRATR